MLCEFLLYSTATQLYIYAYLSQDTEYSSLCYTAGPLCLSILYIVVCICQSQTLNTSLPLGSHKSVPSLGPWACFCFITSVQFSRVRFFTTCSTPGFPVHHQLPEFTQTHVHRVSDAIQPSHPLSNPCPPTFSLSQHQGLFQWVSSSHQVARVLVFQLQHQSFQWVFTVDLL